MKGCWRLQREGLEQTFRERLSKFLEQYGAAPSEELCGATEARPATDLQVEHALDDGIELDHRVVHKNPCARQRSVLTASLGGCSETWLPMVEDKLREIFSECVEKLITDALQVVRQEHAKASLGVVLPFSVAVGNCARKQAIKGWCAKELLKKEHREPPDGRATPMLM